MGSISRSLVYGIRDIPCCCHVCKLDDGRIPSADSNPWTGVRRQSCLDETSYTSPKMSEVVS